MNNQSWYPISEKILFSTAQVALFAVFCYFQFSSLMRTIRHSNSELQQQNQALTTENSILVSACQAKGK